MKSVKFFIYSFTIITLLLDLVCIKIIQSPTKFNILLKLGIFKEYSQHTVASFALFIFGLAILSVIFLTISFVLIIKKLLRSFR